MGWNDLSIPQLQQCNSWSLGIDKKFHPTLYWACDYLSMLGLKLIHVSKRGHRHLQIKPMPGAQPSNWLRWLDLRIEHQESGPSYGRQDDMLFSITKIQVSNPTIAGLSTDIEHEFATIYGMFPEVGGNVVSSCFPIHRELGVPAVCIKSTETIWTRKTRLDQTKMVRLLELSNRSEIWQASQRLPKFQSNVNL